MNKMIILMAGFFILMNISACSKSPSMNETKAEDKSLNQGAPLHMMLMEQMEEDAQDKYAIITEEAPPEGQDQPTEGEATTADDGKKVQPTK